MRKFSLFSHRCLLSLIFIPAIAALSACAGSSHAALSLHPLPVKVSFAGESVPLELADTYERISNWYNFYLTKPWQIRAWNDRASFIFPYHENTLSLRQLVAYSR